MGVEAHGPLHEATRDLRVASRDDVVLVGVHGVLYDVSHMSHPGGDYLMRVYRDHDVSALFEAHHLDIARARKLLGALPTYGTYRVPVAYDYASYAALRDKALRILPRLKDRGMAPWTQACLCVYCCLALWLHLLVLRTTSMAHVSTWCVCAGSAIANTVLGGFGHNAIHRMRPASLLLDWNGLSAYEWIMEHMYSHHMYVNTENDHDALSMRPFLNWTPSLRRSWLSATGRHAIYLVSEIAVAAQGLFGHRLRFRPLFDPNAPLWLRAAPFAFLARAGSHFLLQDPVQATLTLALCLALAGYSFAYLAHLSHANPDPADHARKADFLAQQVAHTRDIAASRWLAHAFLFLDRQVLHHLFPGLDHSRLDRLDPIRPIRPLPLRELDRRANAALRVFRRPCAVSSPAGEVRRSDDDADSPSEVVRDPVGAKDVHTASQHSEGSA